MSEEANLLKDLALILISAGVFTIISKALKQPLILGYILAGFLVGPHMGLFPTVTSTAEVSEWSEIGIIFLLFALGLEFSFKKLLKVGSSALITAMTQCVGMFILGFMVGEAIGWSNMESIFLGGMLSMSSTTIIIKAYDDLGLKDKPFAPLVFGALVFEDLIAVVLMVLLSTLAVSNKFAGGEMLMGLVKLVFFLILWFLVGIYLIPTLLKKAQKYLNDEISPEQYRAFVDSIDRVLTDVTRSWVMDQEWGDSLKRLDKYASSWRKAFIVQVTMKSGSQSQHRVCMDQDGTTPSETEEQFTKQHNELQEALSKRLDL